jgi:hypothetical protein
MSAETGHERLDTSYEPVSTPRLKSLGEAAENEIQQRRGYSLQGILHPERKGKLFEHFVVTGLPSDLPISIPATPLHSPIGHSKSSNGTFSPSPHASNHISMQYKPEILYCYPPSEKVQGLMVTQFTFPEGLSSRNVRRLATEIEMNQVVFAPLSSVEESDSSFVFVLTGEDSLLYGVCVLHEELLRDGLSFVSKVKVESDGGDEKSGVEEEGSDGEASDEGYIVAPRCYMFLTRFPFFSTHFQVLYSLLGLERTRRMFAKMVPDEASAPSEVLALLEQYYSFDVPSGELSLSINLPEEHLNFVCPAGDDDSQLIDYCMACLIKLTPLPMLLQVLAALLQEHQVLIISDQVSIVSALCMGLIPLMRPYVWQGTFIPVVPSSLAECVNSPMPYIMGSTRLPQDALDDLQDVLIWDADSQQLLNVPDGIVPLPYVLSLEQGLSPWHSMLYRTSDAERKQAYLQPYSNSQKDTTFCHAILSVLRQYHKDMHSIILRAIANIPRFDLTKPRHVTKLLVEVGDDSYTPFLKRFLSTQHWHFFHDNMRIGDDSLFAISSLPQTDPTDLTTSSSEDFLPSIVTDSSNSSLNDPSLHPTLSEKPTQLSRTETSSSSVIAAVSAAFDTSLDDDLDDDDI